MSVPSQCFKQNWHAINIECQDGEGGQRDGRRKGGENLVL